MNVALALAAPAGSPQPPWSETVELVREAEALGVDSAWSAEAWILDAVTPLAYLAALTSRIRLGTGILPISARAPAVAAMTALSLVELAGDRVILGLGASGPQVVAGVHGADFARPLTRLREAVAVIRLALAGEALEFRGQTLELPHPSAAGARPMKLGLPPRPELPIHLGTITPRGLALTGECADGWLGQVFLPERAALFMDPLRAGAERAGRSFDALERVAGGTLEVGAELEPMLAKSRASLAFQIGAMGTADRNFYADTYARAGFADAVAEVRTLWAQRKRDAAAAAIPDRLVLQTNLLGDVRALRARVAAYRAAGVTTLRVAPRAETLAGRIEALGHVMDAVSAD